MNPSRVIFRLCFVIVALATGAALVGADSRGAIGRMEARLPAVDQLKEQKVVGENNRGYLEARAALNGPQQGIVSDENADRRALYEAIAQKEGVNIEQVGRARAQKIAAGSRRGVWLQGNDGAWYQKP